MTTNYAKQLCHLDEESAATLLSTIRKEDFGNGYSRGYFARTCDMVKRDAWRDKAIEVRFGGIVDVMRNVIGDRYKLA